MHECFEDLRTAFREFFYEVVYSLKIDKIIEKLQELIKMRIK
jgi:hypothetical protein